MVLEQLPGGLHPLVFARRACVDCFGVGWKLNGQVCPCVRRKLATRPAWLRRALWEAWVERSGGPVFPRSSLEINKYVVE